MESLEAIKSKISSAVSLRSIVKTMKILAAVSMRQYEKMVGALDEYAANNEKGLEIVLKDFHGLLEIDESADHLKTGAIIFGSDMGMCGQFNEVISAFAGENASGFLKDGLSAICLGDRISGRLEDRGIKPESVVPYPAGLSGNITGVMQELLMKIENWRKKSDKGRIVLFYNMPAKEGITFGPVMKRLLPIDRNYLETLKDKKWVSRTIPIYKMDRDLIFGDLIKNMIYAEIFRGFVYSLASENAARLASMQAAEKHIDEHIEGLELNFNHERQEQITSEILDIISGFETVVK